MAAACRGPICSSSASLAASVADRPSLISRRMETAVLPTVLSKLLSRSVYSLRPSITYTPKLKRMSTSANTPMYQSVKRVLTESSISTLMDGCEDVSFPTTCLKQFYFMPVVNLSPQSLNVNVDEVGKDVKVFIPDVLGNLGAAQDLVHVARQVLEQGVFLYGKLNVAPVSQYASRARVDLEIIDLDHFRMQCFTAAQKCPGARQQFTEIERLDEIIGGAGGGP